jgi:hypothetical protein
MNAIQSSDLEIARAAAAQIQNRGFALSDTARVQIERLLSQGASDRR